MHTLHSMMIRFILVLLYYAAGFLLAWAAYVAIDFHYAHAPGPRELIVFITLLGGVTWFMVTVARYTSTRTAERKATILAHLAVFAACAIAAFFYWNTPFPSVDEPVLEIVVETSGDTTVMRHQGNLIYYKVGDSVLINFIDSAQTDWSKVKYRKEPFGYTDTTRTSD